MLPFERMVARYVKAFDRHVLYRVTPIFEGKNPVASGVQIEAASLEDHGQDVCFNVYVFNVQPGIWIDYSSGKSELRDDPQKEIDKAKEFDAYDALDQMMCYGIEGTGQYVVNDYTLRFHRANCEKAAEIGHLNKVLFSGTRKELMDMEYRGCGWCNP